MKEKDQELIENSSLEQLFVMDELLPLYEAQGQDVTEAREKVWEVINSKLKEESPYAHATKLELINLRLQMHRLEEEGIDMSKSIEPLSKEIQSRSEIIYQSGR